MLGLVIAALNAGKPPAPVPPYVLALANGDYYGEDSLSALASFTLQASGTATGGPSVASGSGSYSWLTSGVAAGLEVRATPGTGSFSASPGTGWFAMSSNRTWSVSRGTLGTKACTALFEIREIGGDGTILASATISLTATRTA